MDAVANLPEYQKQEFIKHLEEQQVKDSLKMYNNLVESCFDKCVLVGWGGNFSSKNLSDAESKCVNQCTEKFMKMTQRVGFRFAEYQAQQKSGAQN